MTLLRLILLAVLLVLWLIEKSFWPALAIALWWSLRATAFWIPIGWWFVAMLCLGVCLLAKGWIDWHEWRSRSR